MIFTIKKGASTSSYLGLLEKISEYTKIRSKRAFLHKDGYKERTDRDVVINVKVEVK